MEGLGNKRGRNVKYELFRQWQWPNEAEAEAPIHSLASYLSSPAQNHSFHAAIEWY
jgi:hypothetical protein